MIEVHPATDDRFDDVALILAPKNPEVPACWCLSYRLPNQEQRALSGGDRPARLRRYAEEGAPPGVIAYVDGEPAGWCSVAPGRRTTGSPTPAPSPPLTRPPCGA